jgi:hypothetical protein
MVTKAWVDMTQGEITALKQKQCKTCEYFSKYARGCVGSSTCDYINIIGHSRRCSPLECVEKGIYRRKSRQRHGFGRCTELGGKS